MNAPLKNALLDRDGTVIYDRHYLSDPAGVELLPGALRGLTRLNEWGLKLFVVTNQSGIGRGFFSLEDYQACRRKLDDDLLQAGLRLTDSAFCPHAPPEAKDAEGAENGGCACRKPGIGMWLELSRRHGLAAENTVMIGDKPEDIRFARRAGLAVAILVLSGKGEKSAARLGLPTAPGTFPSGDFFDVNKLMPELRRLNPEETPDCLALDLNGAAGYLEELRQGRTSLPK